MSSSVRERVRRHREALRRAGMRPVQIWVPDTRQPGFRDECRRQSPIVAEADRADADLMDFLDAAFTDLDERAE